MLTDRFTALNSPASVDIECPTSAFSYPQETEADVNRKHQPEHQTGADLCFDLRSTLTSLYTPVGVPSREPRLSVSRSARRENSKYGNAAV